MATQSLFKAGAFGAGADLWIIPHGSQSKWSPKIDWYLNFLLTRAKRHQPQNVSPALMAITRENELEVEHYFDAQNKPLLITSELRFPNKQVVELPAESDHQKWYQMAYEIWQSMNEPTLRVFLPDDSSETDFQKLWPGDLKTEFITLVPNSAS